MLQTRTASTNKKTTKPLLFLGPSACKHHIPFIYSFLAGIPFLSLSLSLSPCYHPQPHPLLPVAMRFCYHLVKRSLRHHHPSHPIPSLYNPVSTARMFRRGEGVYGGDGTFAFVLTLTRSGTTEFGWYPGAAAMTSASPVPLTVVQGDCIQKLKAAHRSHRHATV
ncbi:hypothetical protein LX36DRAFT_433152 [Colletotrichum falcatum]|nr:hypothetical protein LX36DRAFT_433152 [Colletotrichum falcatum]